MLGPDDLYNKYVKTKTVAKMIKIKIWITI